MQYPASVSEEFSGYREDMKALASDTTLGQEIVTRARDIIVAIDALFKDVGVDLGVAPNKRIVEVAQSSILVARQAEQQRKGSRV